MLQVNVQYFEFLSILIPILMIFYLVLAILSVKKLVHKPSKLLFFYSMTNILFVISFIGNEIGIISVVQNSYKTETYYIAILIANILIILTSLFYYLFYAEMSNEPMKNRSIFITIALALILFELIIFPEWIKPATGGMSPKYIALMIQTIYCGYIYVLLGRQFLRLAARTDEKTEELRDLGYGSILMLLFFVLMLSRAFFMEIPSMELTVQIGSWTILAIAALMFFRGYLLPNLKNPNN